MAVSNLLRHRIGSVFFVIGIAGGLCTLLLLGVTRTAQAQTPTEQTPTVTIQPFGLSAYPPTLAVTTTCRYITPHDKLDPHHQPVFNVWEQDHKPQTITPTLSSTASVRVAVLVDITQHEIEDDSNQAQTRTLRLLEQFNDLCAWGLNDTIAAFAPSDSAGYTKIDCLLDEKDKTCWSPDRGAIRNRITRYKQFPNTKRAFTNIPALVSNAIISLTQSSTRTGEQKYLVIFSNGMSQPDPANTEVQKSRKLAEDNHVTILTVLLPDNQNRDPGYLQTLASDNACFRYIAQPPVVSTIIHGTPTNEYLLSTQCTVLNEQDPNSFNLLWDKVSNHFVQFHFRYAPMTAPPFELQVSVTQPVASNATASRPLLTTFQPLTVHIISPRLGDILPLILTNTKLLTSLETFPTQTVAITKEQPVTAVVTIDKPSLPVYQEIAELIYCVDSNCAANKFRTSDTPPSFDNRLPLGSLLPGFHTLRVRVRQGRTDAWTEQSTWFELRPVLIKPDGQQVVEWQKPYYSTLLASLQPGVTKIYDNLKSLRNEILYTLFVILFLLLAVAYILYRRFEMQQTIKKLEDDLKGLREIAWPQLTPANWQEDLTAMKAGLYLLTGSGLPEFIPIKNEGRIQIGSSPWRRGENQIVLHNRYIAPINHCIIEVKKEAEQSRQQYTFRLVDPQGITKVDGMPVNKDNPTVLKSGVTIELVPFVLYKFVVPQKYDIGQSLPRQEEQKSDKFVG